jgi:hypothetical protein
MCRVVKMKYPGIAPSGAIKIGRGSKWGNPFDWRGNKKTIPVKDRSEAIARYEAYLLAKPELLQSLPELKGKDLACWCAPEACHGDVLLRYANDEKFLQSLKSL